jgi:TPR repeat protein
MLRHYIHQDENQSSYNGLWPAAKEGSTKALDALVKLASAQEDLFWLQKAASLNDLQAQLALADLTTGDDQTYWWQQAANNGHGASQFELSFLVDSTEERIRYLEQAAFNQHAPAIIALSKYYYEREDASKALRWLEKAAEFDQASTFKLARMLWKQGFEEKAQVAFIKAAKLNSLANNYADVLREVRRQKISALVDDAVHSQMHCAQQLQFVATSLDSAVQAKTFKTMYENDKRLIDLPICIGPIIWLAENELRCELLNNRKKCDFSEVAKNTFMPSYTHLVLFLDEGKAYVHDGAMYLDEADTYSVFVHELAHFVGFVDEYPVSVGLAEQYCYQTNAPNLLLAGEAGIEQQASFQRWQTYHKQLMMGDAVLDFQNEGSTEGGLSDSLFDQERSIQAQLPSLTVSASRTCSSLGIKTYKPTSKLTFMEYHDTQYIPPIYLLIWKDLLSQNKHGLAISALYEKNALSAGHEQASTYWSSFY